MATASKGSVLVLSRPKPFGPAKQSFEIQNCSQEEVTVFLELLGSEHFVISDASKRLVLKPGASARAQVEFRVPEKGFAIALNAVYKATVQVWAHRQGERAEKVLVDVFPVTGIGPRFVLPDSVHCFDPIGSSEQQNKGKEGSKAWPRQE